MPDCSKGDCIVSLRTINEKLNNSLINIVEEHYTSISNDDVSVYALKEGKKIILNKVFNIKDYGVIGLIIPIGEDGWDKDEYTLSLLFFSRLGAMLLEKIEIEDVNHELAIADEQNRIADDIHDSVVQRLFAMSCLTYDTINKWKEIADEEKKEQMKLVMETIQSSLKDLRSTIYNLSNKKQQIDLFKENITSYLLDLERLSNTRINVDLDDAVDHLSTGVKKALYRIIIESTGNAIRHGKCRNVWVELKIGDTKTCLTIRDDGTGFDLAQAEKEQHGLGLYNIKNLVRIFNGSIEIITDNSGTKVEISYSNADIMKKPE